MKLFLKDKQSGSALLMAVLILASIFTLAFSAAYLSLYSFKNADLKMQGIKAYWAAESGAEALRWEVRKSGLNLSLQPNGVLMTGAPFTNASYELDLASSSVSVIGTYGNTKRVFTVTDAVDCYTDSDCTGNKACINNQCLSYVNYGGETYGVVKIGTQIWMNRNLDIGTMLIGTSTNATDNGIIEKYCYSDIANNCAIYGALYQWNEAMQYVTTEGSQGICPSGWHIPSDAQQNILDQYLTDNGQTCDAARNSTWDCAAAGTKLKSGGTSGFNALLTGYRDSVAWFNFKDSWGFLWSSSVAGGGNAWSRYLYSTYTTVRRIAFPYAGSFSVRCLRN
jgi:uncharacterized protein (TIGR02145 family)